MASGIPKNSKKEAVKQVTVHGYSVADVAERLGTTNRSCARESADSQAQLPSERAPPQSNLFEDA